MSMRTPFGFHIICRPPPTTSEESCDCLKCDGLRRVGSNFSPKPPGFGINRPADLSIVPALRTVVPQSESGLAKDRAVKTRIAARRFVGRRSVGASVIAAPCISRGRSGCWARGPLGRIGQGGDSTARRHKGLAAQATFPRHPGCTGLGFCDRGFDPTCVLGHGVILMVLLLDDVNLIGQRGMSGPKLGIFRKLLPN